jgi:hypothetical protein
MALAYALPVNSTIAVGVTQLEGHLVWIEVDSRFGTTVNTAFATGEEVSAGDARTARYVWPFGIVACGRGVVVVDLRDGTLRWTSLGCGTTEASLSIPGKEVLYTTSIIERAVFVATDHGLTLVDLEARSILGSIELELSAHHVPCRIISRLRAVCLQGGRNLVAVEATMEAGVIARMECYDLAAQASSISGTISRGACAGSRGSSGIALDDAGSSLFCTVSDSDGLLTGWRWLQHEALPTRLWVLDTRDVFPDWLASHLSEAVVVAHPPCHAWLFSLESATAARIHTPTLHAEAVATGRRAHRAGGGEATPPDRRAVTASGTAGEAIRLYHHPHPRGIVSIRPGEGARALVTDLAGASVLVDGVTPCLSQESAGTALCVLGDWLLMRTATTTPAPWLLAWRRRSAVVLWRAADVTAK